MVGALIPAARTRRCPCPSRSRRPVACTFLLFPSVPSACSIYFRKLIECTTDRMQLSNMKNYVLECQVKQRIGNMCNGQVKTTLAEAKPVGYTVKTFHVPHKPQKAHQLALHRVYFLRYQRCQHCCLLL